MKTPMVRLVKSASVGDRQVSLIELRTSVRLDAIVVYEHAGSVSIRLHEGSGPHDGAPRGRQAYEREERRLLGKGGRP